MLLIVAVSATVIGMMVLFVTNSHATKIINTAVAFDEVADSAKAVTDTNKVYTEVERAAEFPGGLDGWRAYLQKNLKYPKKAQKNGTQGEVKIKMTVDKNGEVSNVVIQRDPGDGLGDEALRVIQKGPKWVPAWQKGRNVSYRFVQTVTFQLQ